MAEWSNATVLKTVGPQGLVGSNPTPSASTGMSFVRDPCTLVQRALVQKCFFGMGKPCFTDFQKSRVHLPEYLSTRGDPSF